MALKTSETLLDQLRRHGEGTYPYECCGVLLGKFDGAGGKTVRAVTPCGNICTDSPVNRYCISPAELVHIQREAGLDGHEIVGFYHSHPDHPAQWSATDLAEAHWTGYSYVIISVENGRAVQINSFLLVGQDAAKRLEDEVIEVTA
ncbi:MAG: M67 family metallopeptidase [Terracidiphilus sp.]|nr:M67 family metallopeptidase [Terracidiphilus sp.]MDR3775673.1 M67 family metallopeptidase [Terracidiphilus sp.]